MSRTLGCGSRWLSAVAALLLALQLFAAIAQQPSTVSESEREVKSAFFFNFLKYVEWPASASADTNAPLVVGIPEDDPMMGHLAKIARGRTIGGRRLEIRTLIHCKSAGNVHALWVGAREDKQQEDWLQATEESHVLTIGETEAFARKGGIITFVIDQGKMRFDINMNAARRHGLKIRGQLQQLARKLRQADE